MKFGRLLEIVGEASAFETGLLLAGREDPNDVRRQLSRWTRAGRLYQLRRGLYALAPPYQKSRPDPFVIANRMVPGSYVSLQSALAFHGLIPEFVPVTTSVTGRQPAHWQTPLGTFAFHHLKATLLRGYRLTDQGQAGQAFVATPQKALLDLIHLQAGGDSPDYLRELRLQNLDRLDLDELRRQARHSRSPKLERAAAFVARLARAEALGFAPL